MSRKQEMLDYLPRYYSDSKIVDNKIGRESEEFDLLRAKITDILNQFFVDTATWGLPYWERNFELESKLYQYLSWNLAESNQLTFESIEEYTWDDFETVELDIEQRRGNIRARIRGVGTVTDDLIKDVVKAYTNGNCEVIEAPANYEITIKFTDVDGVPPNLEECKTAIKEIIPAHLNVVFTNQYSLWGDVGATTWGNLVNYTWEDVKGGLWSA